MNEKKIDARIDAKNDMKAKHENPKKLGLRTLVSVEARVRSGCPKHNTNDCGISYRGF
jgi:hypothetical protein